MGDQIAIGRYLSVALNTMIGAAGFTGSCQFLRRMSILYYSLLQMCNYMQSKDMTPEAYSLKRLCRILQRSPYNWYDLRHSVAPVTFPLTIATKITDIKRSWSALHHGGLVACGLSYLRYVLTICTPALHVQPIQCMGVMLGCVILLNGC
jgi:hypothetical protein